jgi:hypothetical protein
MAPPLSRFRRTSMCVCVRPASPSARTSQIHVDGRTVSINDGERRKAFAYEEAFSARTTQVQKGRLGGTCVCVCVCGFIGGVARGKLRCTPVL